VCTPIDRCLDRADDHDVVVRSRIHLDARTRPTEHRFLDRTWLIGLAARPSETIWASSVDVNWRRRPPVASEGERRATIAGQLDLAAAWAFSASPTDSTICDRERAARRPASCRGRRAGPRRGGSRCTGADQLDAGISPDVRRHAALPLRGERRLRAERLGSRASGRSRSMIAVTTRAAAARRRSGRRLGVGHDRRGLS